MKAVHSNSDQKLYYLIAVQWMELGTTSTVSVNCLLHVKAAEITRTTSVKFNAPYRSQLTT